MLSECSCNDFQILFIIYHYLILLTFFGLRFKVSNMFACTLQRQLDSFSFLSVCPKLNMPTVILIETAFGG